MEIEQLRTIVIKIENENPSKSEREILKLINISLKNDYRLMMEEIYQLEDMIMEMLSKWELD